MAIPNEAGRGGGVRVESSGMNLREKFRETAWSVLPVMGLGLALGLLAQQAQNGAVVVGQLAHALLVVFVYFLITKFHYSIIFFNAPTNASMSSSVVSNEHIHRTSLRSKSQS